MFGGPRSLALGLFLCASAGLACSVARDGTQVMPSGGRDAVSDEAAALPIVGTDAARLDAQGLDAGPPDTATPDAADAAAPRIDGGAMPPSWVGPPAIVAVGQGGRRVVSHDGVTFDVGDTFDVAGNGDPTKNFAAAAYGNGLVVAVGGGCVGTKCAGRIATYNGDKWSEVALPTTQSWLAGVAYGNGVWIAVGAAGPVLTSSDGKRWTPSKTMIGSNLRAVVFGKVGAAMTFIATGDRSMCWRSMDGGQTWTATAPLFPNDDPPVTLRAVAIGDGVVVVAGDRGRRIRSINGADWTSPQVVGMDLTSITYADHQFFAYPDNGTTSVGTAFISKDAGQNWDFVSVVEAPGQGLTSGVLRDSRLFVGAAGSTIKTSTDGKGWTIRRVGGGNENVFSAFAFASF
jgi:photosystem II stability/assembly factor-like uncharacterized protein